MIRKTNVYAALTPPPTMHADVVSHKLTVLCDSQARLSPRQQPSRILPSTPCVTIGSLSSIQGRHCRRLCGAIALTCVSALTEAFVSVLVGAGGAALGAHSILQHVAVHAEQAVCPQWAFAGVAAPVALCKRTERKCMSVSVCE